MKPQPPLPARDRGVLDAEWARLALLVTLAEALRTGDTLAEDFTARFEAAAAEVAAVRQGGGWAPLAAEVPAKVLGGFVQLDLDLLALALLPEAQPALAPRLQSLQPQVGAPYPCLAVLQELLSLEGGEEVSRLFDRLDPTAPLVAGGLLRVEGEGAYQCIRPTLRATRAVLGRATGLAPPPGAHLAPGGGGFGDLVLPEAALRSLRDYVAWIRFGEQIATGWGGRRLGGPLALFAGPSGTGKSFAAAVVAAELGRACGAPWALYTLDLGRIMSKYIGETEQNVNALLDALEGRRAVLQIDEADGLLGKRGEISDARDRYANLEVSHLLSRFERHAGPVILTTNLRTNIDSAFLRRFQIVVDFPPPDATARAQLWAALLPPNAPRAAELDTAELAQAARLSGGAIHNAAWYAAVIAAEEEAAIAPRHVARAVWAELRKDNRQVRRSELGFLADHLEGVPS